MSRQDHEHLVGIEDSQIHEFESDKLTHLPNKIADKIVFELANHKPKVLEKNTMMFHGGADKALFPMTLIAWRGLYHLASCMIIVIQMHNVLATSVITGKGFS